VVYLIVTVGIVLAAAVAAVVRVIHLSRPGPGHQPSRLPGRRVQPGGRCPRCGGTIRPAHGRLGPFLGCSNFNAQNPASCHRAWNMDGSRLPGSRGRA
jgi:hypothetical protein